MHLAALTLSSPLYPRPRRAPGLAYIGAFLLGACSVHDPALVGDSGLDAARADGGSTQVDAGEDARRDATPTDAPIIEIDAGELPDGGFDAGRDSGAFDAGRDAGTDVGPYDAGNDSGSDAGPITCGPPDRVTAYEAGYYHACAVTDDCGLYCWGQNLVGQLGNGDSGSEAYQLAPVRIGGDERQWRSVAAGHQSTCAIDASGLLHCWGLNDSGQLGLGPAYDSEMIQTSPVQVGERRWLSVDSGDRATCAIDTDHKLYCWGSNSGGELGLGDTVNRNVPTFVSDDWESISLGYGSACGVRRSTRTLYCWGNNSNGELGLGDMDDRDVPTLVGEPSDEWETEFASGTVHRCGILVGGTVYCWGGDFSNNLGTDVGSDDTLPGLVVGGPSNWKDVKAGFVSTTGVASTGHIYVWGFDPTLHDYGLAMPISATPRWESVSVGRYFICALSASGDLACAGDNIDGSLGTGDTESHRDLTAVAFPE